MWLISRLLLCVCTCVCITARLEEIMLFSYFILFPIFPGFPYYALSQSLLRSIALNSGSKFP